ncbi:MAG TPA: aspartyl protease family protein [Candidatus Udaeobacter sp.]|nr:aspartyl protease family protein [Candidatus Udaeobacter sp.]
MRFIALAATLLLLALLRPALADWQQPDPSYRDAQFALRAAIRDTAGQGANAARLDTLALAHLRLAHFADARRLFQRVLAANPADVAARASVAKLALFADRPAEAESLLQGSLDADETAPRDLFAARVRLGRYADAATLADSLGLSGRAEMLRRMAEGDAYTISGSAEGRQPFARSLPVPLVRVKLNGESVLMAIDLGAGSLLIDDFVGRQAHIDLMPSMTPVVWDGTHVTVRNALVRRLEIGGVRIDNVPAGVLGLRRWGLAVNPDRERVAGVIGIDLLRRFSPVLDYHASRIELRPAGAAIRTRPGARRVPFELWGEDEMMVYGTIGGGRRMAMWVATGIPDCGIAAPPEVFEELGIKPGVVSRMMKSAGGVLQGAGWTQVSVPAVAVGPVARDRMSGAWGAIDSSELWRHGVRRDAALSSEFFRGWRVTIDWSARELVFEDE